MAGNSCSTSITSFSRKTTTRVSTGDSFHSPTESPTLARSQRLTLMHESENLVVRRRRLSFGPFLDVGDGPTHVHRIVAANARDRRGLQQENGTKGHGK